MFNTWGPNLCLTKVYYNFLSLTILTIFRSIKIAIVWFHCNLLGGVLNCIEHDCLHVCKFMFATSTLINFIAVASSPVDLHWQETVYSSACSPIKINTHSFMFTSGILQSIGLGSVAVWMKFLNHMVVLRLIIAFIRCTVQTWHHADKTFSLVHVYGNGHIRSIYYTKGLYTTVWNNTGPGIDKKGIALYQRPVSLQTSTCGFFQTGSELHTLLCGILHCQEFVR